MQTFLIVITVVTFLLLVIVSGMRPLPGELSRFELDRRGKEAKAARRREKQLPDILGLLRLKKALLLVITVVLLIVGFGWLIGILCAVLVALFYETIAALGPIHRASQRLYQLLEPWLLNLIGKAPRLFSVFRGLSWAETDRYRRFDSREELQYLIEQSGEVLSDDERRLIAHALDFRDQQVKHVMTARGDIRTIKKSEFLGPLVLSELHETGHSRLPVISNDLDHVVGILHLKDLLSLDIKRSVTAEKAMEAKVYYIHQEDSLEHALAAFLKSHHQLFVVIDDDRRTVGVLSLEDVIEALLGRQIFDEDDNHESVHAVASRRAEPNNTPENGIDL